MATTSTPVLLGEWACLGILYTGRAHGFAVASRLRRTGDVGVVWSLSRPLTYRALDKLTGRGWVEAVGEEPGVAGGNRTILAATRRGRAELRRWLARPVPHIRDLRSELLLKLVIADLCQVDVTDMLRQQHEHVQQVTDRLARQVDEEHPAADVVALWRWESAQTALRFLERITPSPTP